ncbi:hypothetical protein FDU21_07450 [Xanthomonas oryzae pv. oryzae]|nr:hypothetical protein FDU21_07450 [Xanthomonas oryzae pv. oryzae]
MLHHNHQKLLDANSDGINTLEEAASQLKKAPIINFLAGTICKFPTEWQKSTIATRWDWTTKESPPGSPANSVGSTTYLTQKDFVKFQSYAEALCFGMRPNWKAWRWPTGTSILSASSIISGGAVG